MSTMYIENFREKIESRSNVVIWSGGCDSTLLLYETAKMCKEKDKKVYAISLDINLLSDYKLAAEDSARDKLKKVFIAAGLDNIVYHEYKIRRPEVRTFMDGGTVTGLPQQTIWSLIACTECPSDSNVLLGYIEGDHVWQRASDLSNFQFYLNRMLDKNIEFVTPYSYHTKGAIITKLLEYGLYDHVWYCEDPRPGKKPCGVCHPCRTHRDALVSTYLSGDCEQAGDILKGMGYEIKLPACDKKDKEVEVTLDKEPVDKKRVGLVQGGVESES